MNRRKILLLTANIAGVVAAFGFIAAFYVYSRYDKSVFATFLAIGTLGVAGYVTLRIIAAKTDKVLLARWQSYLRLAHQKAEQAETVADTLDYRAELSAVRKNFAADSSARKNRIAKPEFAGTRPFCKYSVLSMGKIVYGCLVEANEKIFEPSHLVHGVYPAVVVYGTDDCFEQDPAALRAVAEDLFKNRHNNFLRNETEYFANKRLPHEWTNGKTVYCTTVLLYRYHLPIGCIRHPHTILPVIVDPNGCTSVFVVDCKYWTDGLVSDYLFSNNYSDQSDDNQ